MSKRYQVVGIGNAMVDILSHIEDDFLSTNGVEKGIMQLIDANRAIELYGKMGPAKEISGGSAANTIAGLAQLRVSTAYVGKVRDDQLGDIFAHDIKAQGADYDTPRATGDAHETGRCMVLVSPDGERSMNTYLGWSEFLTPADIDPAVMGDTDWIYLEGYRFDGPDSHEAFAKAIAACKAGGGRVSLTLSDPFCVERHRDAFRKMIQEDVDLLFANEHEIESMYQTGALDTSMAAAAQECDIVACTVGAKGAHILAGGEKHRAPADPVTIVDATGAGDLFASGFLYGLTHGHDLLTCGKMGCAAAGEVISHIGARPEDDLMKLFRKSGLVGA